ncbi:MAG: hypothetical protein A3C35_05760 [Omnitrophica bacterium RIFCSPHIGHO2_02_FULL_46_11]|nr:MAG: hypothetical protein A3C35_05760 [Omnitrophica bacterium RIFCSPHIGHO2_02_FULL_46_11]OGW86456.1 MAG: hypothetical protein A3A81_02700 [Omnitrophica bacterium RIFCSPLOWO2_01_FULL_45_10b]
MGIIENAKDIADVIKKIGDVELYRQIVNLEGQIIDLTRSNRKLENEIERLREITNYKNKLIFKNPFYYLENDPHPFCPKCWEANRSVVHLDGPLNVVAGSRYDCHNCKDYYIAERN